MTSSKLGVRAVLIVLFIAAVWVRMHAADERRYPYYDGESATNFRHANLIVESGSLPPIDSKTSWPDGYEPAPVGPNGAEYLTGFTYRTFSMISDMTLKQFSGRFLGVLFSLCVFTFYRIGREVWSSRASGLVCAFLVAFSGPVVMGTFGREYLHAPLATLLISIHIVLLLTFFKAPRTGIAVLAALVALALTSVWRTADIYLAASTAVFLFMGTLGLSQRRTLIAAHFVAILLAGLLWPHLRAERFLLGWVPCLYLSSMIYVVAQPSLPKRVSGWAWVAGGTIILTLVLAPLAKGGAGVLSEIDYWMYRLRFVLGKPDNPLELSDASRFLWTQDRTFPRLLTWAEFFLPLVFLIQPVIKSLRGLRGISPAIVFAAVGTGLFLIDRSAVFAAALGVFPLASAAARGIGHHFRVRIVPITVAGVLVLAQTFVPHGKANPSHMLTSALGGSTQQTDGFLWISIGNADLDLVKYVTKRTSVVDAMMTPPAISSLLVSFAGRTTVLTPGIYTVDAMERTNRFMKLYYADENDLYAECDANDIRYVLYSIDLLLDTSNYSERYTAGLGRVREQSLAYLMHFEPERLRHFNLVYENDNFRLFRVTKSMEPFFVTDHPPVYQKSILEQYNSDIEVFYENVVDALLTYQLAIEAQAQGEEEEAIRRFRYCVGIAPRFTNAWLGVGDSLFRLGDMAAANAAYSRALDVAPDNPNALYNKALTMVRLGKINEAQGLLDVLISSTRDRVMLRQAYDLKAAIDRDYPQGEGSSPQVR